MKKARCVEANNVKHKYISNSMHNNSVLALQQLKEYIFHFVIYCSYIQTVYEYIAQYAAFIWLHICMYVSYMVDTCPPLFVYAITSNTFDAYKYATTLRHAFAWAYASAFIHFLKRVLINFSGVMLIVIGVLYLRHHRRGMFGGSCSNNASTPATY